MINEKYQFKSFLNYPNIVHGISTKAFGSMKKKDLQIDITALSRFALSAGCNDEVVTMRQIHSGNISVIENTNVLRIAETDALITNKQNISLAVLTADCLPILFYDPQKEAIGIAHAGYKGLLNHIIENMVECFVSQFKSNPEDIVVGIGPGIEIMCYEVGKEVIGQFENIFPTFTNMYIKKKGKFYLNLRHIAQQCLLSKGIIKEHIEIMDICTKCDGQFYSYRGGDGEKRFASLISLI